MRGVGADEREGVTEVADGVLRIHRAGVNCYLVDSGEGLTLIDAGLPGMWRTLRAALDRLNAKPEDLSAVLLTHGHFDHVGLSRRLEDRHGVASRVHPADRALARHPYRYRRESARWRYPLRYPRAVPVLARMTAAGALSVRGVDAGEVTPGAELDVPGRPVPVWTPGHTDGHCAYLLPDQGILFSGDALVTLDPYTGHRGPRMVARAATADVSANVVSLGKLAATEARVTLPGHGALHSAGIRAAVAEALRAGAA